MYKKPTFLHYFKEDSLIFRIWFWRKFLLFFLLSIFAIINGNPYINICLLLLFFLRFGVLGFFNRKRKLLLFLLFSFLILAVVRLLFTKVPGNHIFFTFPWHTYISDWTIYLMLLSVTKRLLVMTVWIFFMIISSEDELISFLLKNRFSRKFVFMISITFNTFGFLLRDSEIVSYAFASRTPHKKSLFWRMKKLFLILKTLFLSNIKRIETLNNAFYLKSNDYKKNA